MGITTKISWTDHTFNPWMGCARVSEGCRHCYAETLTTGRMGLRLWGPEAPRQVTKAPWQNLLRWNAAALRAGVRRRVFCASLGDVFEAHAVADATRPRMWDTIGVCQGLDFQILTKRPERIAECLPASWGPGGWPHVWLGTTIEDLRVAHRADALREIPAVVRFVSYEPALGPLDALDLRGIDWVIYGGESGPRFRPDDRAWARGMRDACQAAGIAFWHKQVAASLPGRGIELDGELHHSFPVPRVVTTT